MGVQSSASGLHHRHRVGPALRALARRVGQSVGDADVASGREAAEPPARAQGLVFRF